jgi:Bacterial SCP ortholog
LSRDLAVLEKVKAVLEMITQIAPGNSVELRIPPYSAVQCISGTTHRRGTPPNVVEMSAETLFDLLNQKIDWATGIENGKISASGTRSDLSDIFHQLAESSTISSAIISNVNLEPNPKTENEK